MERSGSFTLAAAVCSLALPAARSADQDGPCKLLTASLQPLAGRAGSSRAALDAAQTRAEQLPTPEASPAEQRPESVVVGAGPAGILAAVYLARRGHEVHVYERRPSPLACDSSDDAKAFVLMLQTRGERALTEAGFNLEAMAGPGTGLQRVTAVGLGAGSKRLLQYQQPRMVGSRHALCAALVRQAQAMRLPGHISWHWGTSFEGADLAAKTATFSSSGSGSGSSSCCQSGGSCEGEGSPAGLSKPSGGSTSTSTSSLREQQQGQERHTRAYDLLVAADGGWSRVRRAAEQQVPELRASIEPSNSSYKVFRGLPPSDALPLVPHADIGASSSGSEGGGKGSSGSKQGAEEPALPQMRVLFSTGRGLSLPGIIFVGCDPSDGTARGIVSLPTQVWEEAGLSDGVGPEAYAAFLARHFPALPPEWSPLLAAQMAERPLVTAGMRVHASQLHGPSLLLLGDAGHGVTPRTGNGATAATEDAWLMDQLLEQSGGDLSTLPERFTAARLEDARALLWLDGTASARSGTTRWGMAHPAALAWLASTVVRSALTKATRGWVGPPSQAAMNNSCVPYSQVKAQLCRDGALVAAAAVGAAAALAAACLRRR